MKISYRTNPIIKYLETGTTGFKIAEIDKNNWNHDIGQRINSFLSEYKKELQGNIKIITQPFADAIDSAQKKLIDLYNEQKIELFTGISTGVLCYSRMTEIYTYNENKMVLLNFYRDILTAYIEIYNDNRNYIFLSNSYGSAWNFKRNEIVDLLTQSLLLTVWFIKHCEIKIKFLPPKKKIKDINCKYFNETNSNIQILDSTWFTTLVQSNGFKVRGHFRLQPCGEGMKDRKIIWINDFEKHGYTRHFKRPVTLDEFEI